MSRSLQKYLQKLPCFKNKSVWIACFCKPAVQIKVSGQRKKLWIPEQENIFRILLKLSQVLVYPTILPSFRRIWKIFCVLESNPFSLLKVSSLQIILHFSFISAEKLLSSKDSKIKLFILLFLGNVSDFPDFWKSIWNNFVLAALKTYRAKSTRTVYLCIQN